VIGHVRIIVMPLILAPGVPGAWVQGVFRGVIGFSTYEAEKFEFIEHKASKQWCRSMSISTLWSWRVEVLRNILG
jgi:hypothetical protein